MKKIGILFLGIFLLSSCNINNVNTKNIENTDKLEKNENNNSGTRIDTNTGITEKISTGTINEENKIKDSKEKLEEIIDDSKENTISEDSTNKTIEELTKDFDEDLDGTIEEILNSAD